VAKQVSFIKPVEIARAHELAVEHTIDAISYMDFKVGDRLPSESELAESLDVSRPTVREALKILKKAEFVSVRKGNGGGVFLQSDLLPIIVFKPVSYELDEIDEILTARRTLEGAITRLAIKTATESDFSAIQRAIDLMQQYLDDFEGVMRADMMFHRAIHRAAHNRVLERAMREVMRPFNVIRQTYALPRDDPKLTIELCKRQLDAMRRRDLAAVEAVFDQHMRILEVDFGERRFSVKAPKKLDSFLAK